jgi:pyruvate-ferredoxin/flavodoxin oxidoreductase
METGIDHRLTFADFAAGEARFRKHYRPVPRDADPESLVHVADYLELDPGAREDRLPFVWLADRDGRTLERRLVAPEVIAAAEERRAFWRQLRSLTGADLRVDPEAIAAGVREDMARRLSASLLALAGDSPAELLARAAPEPAGDAAPEPVAPASGAPAHTTAWEPVWIEPGDCTACDECIQAAPGVFAYDAERRAQVTNPRGAPYRDIVAAAERCTAGCIHPGTPHDPAEPDLERLVQRAEAFQ